MSEGGDTLPLKHVAQGKMPHIDTAMGSTFIHINHFLIMIFTSTDATRLSVSLCAVPNTRTVHPTASPPKLGASVPLMPLAEAWFMLVGVVTTLGLTVKQPGGALSKSGAHQSVGGESKFDAPQSVSAPRVKRAQAKREGSPPPVRRRITSTTFLRFMNLTSDMVRHLVLAPDKLSLACVVHADRNRRPVRGGRRRADQTASTPPNLSMRAQTARRGAQGVARVVRGNRVLQPIPPPPRPGLARILQAPRSAGRGCHRLCAVLAGRGGGLGCEDYQAAMPLTLCGARREGRRTWM